MPLCLCDAWLGKRIIFLILNLRDRESTFINTATMTMFEQCGKWMIYTILLDFLELWLWLWCCITMMSKWAAVWLPVQKYFLFFSQGIGLANSTVEKSCMSLSKKFVSCCSHPVLTTTLDGHDWSLFPFIPIASSYCWESLEKQLAAEHITAHSVCSANYRASSHFLK